jgi:glycosyltransferase involved in cell wall biosynthesis
MNPELSVVLPAYNEAAEIGRTVDALVEAVRRSGLVAEVILVDDGSTDDTVAVAEQRAAGRLPLRVLRQPNSGRLEARRAGLEAADADLALLLDARVTLAPDALRFVAGRVGDGDDVWTGHVDVAAGGNPFALFWKLLAELAWEEYFADPRTTRFGAADFDHFPKGAGCFVAPRQLLLDAFAAFHSYYAEQRFSNDDTPVLRWVAERRGIGVSPQFSGVYVPRTRLATFLRHSFRRGTVFLDGHGRRESRFFWAAVAFYPASALLVVAALRRPAVLPAATAAVSAAAAALGVRRHRSAAEIASLAALAPLYAAAHGAGMWRGLGLAVREHLRESPLDELGDVRPRDG